LIVNDNPYIVVELSSGRKIVIKNGKEARFVHGTTALLSSLDLFADGKIRVIINVENVAVIRRAEDHELKWCESFHF
jgi:hypothetical protein